MLKEKTKKYYNFLLLFFILIISHLILIVLIKFKNQNNKNYEEIQNILKTNKTINNFENCEKILEMRDIIYMFINDKTDIDFYRNQKIDNHMIYVIDSMQTYPKDKICVIKLNGNYEYETLDAKVFETLTMIRYYFPNFQTISKLDDDAIISYDYYQNLMRNITINTYSGLFYGYNIKGFGILNFATGHFYTLGKNAVQCTLKNYRIFRKEKKPAEDLSIGYTISEYCKSIKSLHLNKDKVPIYHKKYNNNKNKLCSLE